MHTEAAFPLTPTIFFICYGKIMFHLRAHFQEGNNRVNWEVAVLKQICLTASLINFYLKRWSPKKIFFFISHLEYNHKNEIIMCFDAKYLIVLYRMLFM
jgi:hypothetical protein